MFQRDGNAFLLSCRNERRGHLCRQQRIFAVAFRHASKLPGARHIERWAKHSVHAGSPELTADHRAVLRSNLRIETGGNGQRVRSARNRPGRTRRARGSVGTTRFGNPEGLQAAAQHRELCIDILQRCDHRIGPALRSQRLVEPRTRLPGGRGTGHRRRAKHARASRCNDERQQREPNYTP